MLLGNASVNVCRVISDNIEKGVIHSAEDEKKLSSLVTEYGESVQKYLDYPDRLIGCENCFPPSQIHTMISGGTKPFSIVTQRESSGLCSSQKYTISLH